MDDVSRPASPVLAEDALLGLLAPFWQLIIGAFVLFAVLISIVRLARRGPSRMSTAPARYGEVDLPPASWVIVLLGAANRDPRRYPDPARFDPWRAQIAPLSFGAGPHYCLGAALARLEAQVAFPLLLRRLPEMALAGRPERRVRLTLRGHATLPVRVGREAAPVTVPGTRPGAAGPTP